MLCGQYSQMSPGYESESGYRSDTRGRENGPFPSSPGP